jgi:hypothetical protein
VDKHRWMDVCGQTLMDEHMWIDVGGRKGLD